MSPDFPEHVTRLLLVGAFVPIAGLVGMCLLRWMIDGEIAPIPAILCFAGLFAGMIISIASANLLIAGIVLVTDITLCAFFPYARDALEATEMKAIDTDQMEKAHARLAEHPNNIGSVFIIARSLHSLGLYGHAIRIAENGINSLRTEYLDPIKFQSMRDIYRNEEAELKKWQRANPNEKTFRPIRCKACGFTNQAGTIACGRCKAPYLLELARSSFARRRATARLMAGWGTIALLLPLCGWAGVAVPNIAWMVILGGVVGAGVILSFLFRPPQLRAGA